MAEETQPPSPAYTILQDYTSTNPLSCAVCSLQTASTRLCPACHGIAYCGPIHESQDRPNHALICPAASSLPPRPSGQKIAAVLVLPEHSKNPYYTWVPYKLNRHGLPVFDQTAFYGPNYKSRPTFILRHPSTKETLPHAITVFQLIHPKPVVKPSTTNLCIHNLTDGMNSSAFKGTVLIITLAREMDESRTWLVSFKPADMSILLPELKNPSLQTSPSFKVSGIKAVACYPSHRTGENNLVFEELDIPTNHPIFTLDRAEAEIYTPPLGNVYRFPIRMYRYLDYPGKKGNSFIPRIFPTIEMVRSQSGTRPMVTKSHFLPAKLGAVVFARTDGRALEVLHLKEFAEFVGYATGIWNEYDGFVKEQEVRMEKLRKEGGKVYVRIEKAQMEMVVKMDRTLEGGAFREFWAGRQKGLGPFEGVSMDPDEEEEDEDVFDVDSL
ncbi:hypothetical protein TWF481_005920 [Arthrobotrys musiformis]|uniref:MYND-type domain-containing protein n=1 Tax=Arthrobotrys musiformis TaxID=47236 RepID=A0AAV9WH81_9PEZI